jgi:hypothetical protein
MAAPEVDPMATASLCTWGGFALQVMSAAALHLWPKHRWFGWVMLLCGWLVIVVAFARWYTDRDPSSNFLLLAIAGGLILPALVFVLPFSRFRRRAEMRRLPLRLEPALVGSSNGACIPSRGAPPPTVPAQTKLRMSCGEEGQFVHTKFLPPFRTTRTLSLRIDNTDDSQAITDIKVTVQSIRPQGEYSGPWLLDSAFAIAAGDHKMIPLAQYNEASQARYATPIFDRSATFFEILTQGQKPALSKEGIHTVAIKTTGIGTAPCDYECTLWIERSDGRLRIAVTNLAPKGHPQPLGSPLKIELGHDERYDRIESFQESGVVRRTLHFSVRNDSLRDIADCRIKLTKSMPGLMRGSAPCPMPVFFREDFDLAATQSKFIALASFAERPGNTDALHRNNVVIQAAVGGAFAGWTVFQAPARDAPARLILEASAPDAASRETHISLWVEQPSRRLCAAIV